MTDEQPIAVLQAALDAVADDKVDAVTLLLARAAALPAGILHHVVTVGEHEVRRLGLAAQPPPTFPEDRRPLLPHRQPTVEDVVGNPKYKWPRGT